LLYTPFLWAAKQSFFGLNCEYLQQEITFAYTFPFFRAVVGFSPTR
jgi:hypothetical protein